MSQPKNSTAADKAQLLTTHVGFCNERNGELFSVRAGIPAIDALNLAVDLANGLQLLHRRLGAAINDDQEAVYACEMRGLEFLSDALGSLIFSASLAMKDQEGAQ